MEESPASTDGPTSKSSHFGRSRAIPVFVRVVLYVSLVSAIGVVAYAVFRETQEQAYVRAVQDRLVASHGLVKTTHKRLAPEYTDKQGRLLADPPADPAKVIAPETLVLAHYIDADAETQAVDWEGLQSLLAQATGKQVVGQEYRNTADEVASIKAGGIQLVALHAADAPYVVNNAGFIPVAVLGTNDGAHGNHLDIAVRSESKVKSLGDLHDHTLTCTRPDSITGYRAAIAILSQDAGMRPDVDYFVNWSLGQRRSVEGLAAGEFEIAALSDDKVRSMIAAGDLKESDLRVIYQSQVIPRLTIGYVYNLQPELASKVTTAVLEFQNAEGAPDEDTGQPLRFLASDYKRDFEFVRRIDDSFDPRFRETPKEQPAPELATGVESN